jgi:hypothetical protein
MSEQASVLRQVPENVRALEVVLSIPPDAPARRITLLADGKVLGEDVFAQPGNFRLAVPFQGNAPQVTVGLRVDATHTVPPDDRALGVVITGVGFR